MGSFIKLIMLAFSALVLTGCYAPENFNAELDFKEDGSYTFRYKGDLAYIPLIMDIKNDMSSDREKKLGNEHLVKMKKDTNTKRAEYVGKGRYKVEIEERIKPGQKFNFMGILSVIHTQDGNIKLSTSKIKEKDIDGIKSLVLNVKGNLSVSIPQNAKVLSNDADSTPTLGIGDYKWNIKSINDDANMVLTINK